MLKGSGWRKGQECAHSWLKNHPLGFIGRGKVLTQTLWPGMEARVRGSDGKLEDPDTEAVDVDGMYVGRDGLPKQAILNRLRFGQDGALIEGAYTSDADSDFSDHSMLDNVAGEITRNLNTSNVTDPLGGNSATELIFPAVSGAGAYAFLFVSPGGDQTLGQSVWLRGASGGEVIYFFVRRSVNSDPGYTTMVCNLTTSWQRFAVGDVDRQHQMIGVALTNISVQVAQPAMTVYAWGGCFQNQFAFGTGTVDGDNPITVSADDIRYANAGEAICKAAQGTAIMAVTPDFDAVDIAAQARILDVRPADNADGWTLLADDGSNSYNFKVRSGGATIADIDSSVVVPVKGRTDILAVSWKLNEYTLYANGAQEGQDTAGAVPTAMNTSLYLGQNNAAVQRWFGKINRGVFTEPVLSSRQVENATAVLRKAA